MPTALTLSEAVWVRLSALTTPKVHDGVVTLPRPQADAVYYPDAGTAFSDRQGGGAVALRWGCSIVCTGLSRRQALNSADLIRAQLTGWSPDGWSVLEEDEINAPLLRDDDVTPPRFSNTLRFRITTTRS